MVGWRPWSIDVAYQSIGNQIIWLGSNPNTAIMFNIFKKKSKIDLSNLGLIPDQRSVEEQKLDFQASEIFAFAPIEWKEKPESEWRKYEIFNQVNLWLKGDDKFS